MAKTRYVDTRFWHDTFIRDYLNPLDRYLFLYFLTNDKTNISGIYELPLSMIANETGIDKETLGVMIKRLDGKIHYIEGWVYIANFQKYQSTGNPKIKAGIKAELDKIPNRIIEEIKLLQNKQIPYTYPIDTLSHSNSNLNSNTNSNSNTSGQNPQVNDFIDLFKVINPSYSKLFANKTQRGCADRLLKLHGLEKLKKLLNVISQTNGDKYAPVITTPSQLEDKFGQLIAYGQKKQNNNHPII
jgi:hypothetical protein